MITGDKVKTDPNTQCMGRKWVDNMTKRAPFCCNAKNTRFPQSGNLGHTPKAYRPLLFSGFSFLGWGLGRKVLED